MTAPAPACPRCGAPMITLIAPSGQHAGQPIWSCSTYPMCRGMVAAADDAPTPDPRPLARLRPRRIGGGWVLALWLVTVGILLAYALLQA